MDGSRTFPESEAAAIAARHGASLRPGVTVQRVATGVSGAPRLVWDGYQLVYEDTAAAHAAGRRLARKGPRPESGTVFRIARKPSLDAALIERRKVVADLHAKGFNIPEIIQQTGHADHNVRADLKAQGLTPHNARGKPREMAALLSRLRELACGGATLVEMAAAVGRSKSHIYNLCKEQGIRFRHAQMGPPPGTPQPQLRRQPK